MALTLNAEQKSIYKIFSGKTHYFIPPYQRAYSWQLQHCRELFEDLKREFYNEEKEGYFLGNIVLALSIEEKNRFEVIDGQQRLTTLLLLLKVALAFDSKNSDIENAIWLIDSRTKEIIGERLQFSDYVENSSLYREVLELELSSELCKKEIDEKNLFRQNICYFYNEIKKLNEYEKIENFVDFLLHDVSLLPIEAVDSTSLKAREKALKIFETINNRGLNLSNADIFKARLYEEAINELEEDRFIELWNEFERNVNETKYSIDDVFYIYMYIIRGREGIKGRELNIRDFFMEEDYSPFGNIKYDVIINDIIRIVYSIKFFEEVKINPNQYGELTKWFQIISEYEGDILDIQLRRIFGGNILTIPISSLLPIIQLSVISWNDKEKMVLYFKKIVKYLLSNNDFYDITSIISDIIYNKEINNDKLRILYTSMLENPLFNVGMLVIVGNYLNKNQKAIYPYYFKKILTDEILDRLDNKVILNVDAKNDITLEEKIKLLEKSEIEDNIQLAKELKKITKVKFIDKMIIGNVLKKREKMINERIESFLKDEN